MHIVLPEGPEDRTGSIPQPAHRHPGQRWLTGNLVLAGLGALGMGAAGSGFPDAHPTIADELHFELGVGLGLLLGASANMLLSAELGEHGAGLMLIRFAAVPVLVGIAMPLAMSWSLNQRCPPHDGETQCEADQGVANTSATVAGAFFGMALSTFSNITLSFREIPVAASMATTFFGAMMIQTFLALSSLGAANDLRADADEMQGSEAVDAYASADAHETMGEIAGATGLVFLGLAAASTTLAIVGDSDELDLTVSMGPGTVSVSGVF